jgi:tetratricopeptide (TPR) repeat protein
MGERPQPPRLTPREHDVLTALCGPIVHAENVFTEPASVQEIAHHLVVTEAAVKQHLLRLYDKFEIWEGTRRRVRLANEALRLGIVRLSGRIDHVRPEDAGDPLEAGRAASMRREWEQAFAQLSAAAVRFPLGANDLELLGEAGWFSDHHSECDQALERAHAAFMDVGDRSGAARTAVTIANHHICRRNLAIAGGWVQKGKRLVDEEPECKERGDVAAQLAMIQLATGESELALENGRMASDIGRRLGHADALVLGLTAQGYALIRLGRVGDGLALLDEGMAAAATERLSAPVLGLVYCRTISACLDLFDYRRALEWTEEVERRSDTAATAAFPGDCLTHRIAVWIVRGEWSEGERGAAIAATSAFRFDLNHAAAAAYELGEIRLRRGDLDGAEVVLLRAHDLGSPAQPGMALLHLKRGDVDAATSSIASALAAVPGDRLLRARLLPARIEIALAAGDLETAAIAAGELDGLGERYGTTALRAEAACSNGLVRLARGDPIVAVRALTLGLELWSQVGAPYEAARARRGLADALLALGDRAGSAAELRAARSTFEALGARIDLEGVAVAMARTGALT